MALNADIIPPLRVKLLELIAVKIDNLKNKLFQMKCLSLLIGFLGLCFAPVTAYISLGVAVLICFSIMLKSSHLDEQISRWAHVYKDNAREEKFEIIPDFSIIGMFPHVKHTRNEVTGEVYTYISFEMNEERAGIFADF